jgi:ABC-2 type transport system ATP-binding protein
MKIITGYLGQDSGEAVVCGIPVKDRPLETKKKIGYLPEANPLYPDMYVREYLDFVADVHSVTDKRQKIETVIAMVGLTPTAYQSGSSSREQGISKAGNRRLRRLLVEPR